MARLIARFGNLRHGWDRLDTDDRRTVLRAAALLSVVRVVLPRRGLASTRAAVGRVPLGRPASVAPSRATQLVEGVVRRVGGDATCLQRSLVLVHLLEHDGWPARLQIGVRRHEGAAAFHAWVTLDGVVLNDSAEEVAKYAPFDPDRLPTLSLR